MAPLCVKDLSVDVVLAEPGPEDRTQASQSGTQGSKRRKLEPLTVPVNPAVLSSCVPTL